MNRIGEAFAWWVALLLIYLALLSSVTVVEVVVGAGVAVLCSVLAVLGRQAEWTIFGLRPGWVRWFPAVLADIVTDTITLTALVANAIRGLPPEERRVHRLELPPEPRQPVARTRRAALTVLLSLTPGTYVIDTRPRQGGADVLIVHRLGSRPRLAEEARR